MKSFLSFLTVLVVFIPIFSSSAKLKCHTCYTPNDFCSQKGAGEVLDCSETDIACRTTMNPSTGTVIRSCVDKGGANTCNTSIDPWKCHMCYTNSCNTEDHL